MEANAEDEIILSSLPIERGFGLPSIYLFQELWCAPAVLKGVNIFQKQFEAKDSDIFVASFLKSGTTWLKAITFAIANRQCFSIDNHPLLTSNPHQLVPCIEIVCRGDFDCPTEPRIFGTHTPVPFLPNSIVECNSKIVYICRNPFDIFVSSWIFYDKVKAESLNSLKIEEAFEMYCDGIIEFGPWWSHMVGYLKESLAKPDKVLFLKYEDLKDDANFQVKRIAEFLGFPFTQEEENNQVIESIIKLCSFEEMKNLEVNKSGIVFQSVENKSFFRKGESRDWVNYFSPSMTEKLSQIMEEKFGESGLSFMI